MDFFNFSEKPGRLTFILSLILLFLSSTGYGQSDTLKKKYHHSLSASFESGYVLKSGAANGDSLLRSSKYIGFNINYGWRKQTADLYATLYRHPVTGVGFYFSSFNNKLGNVSSVYYYITTPFLSGERRLNAYYTFGFGVAYLTATHGNNNLQDIFIASHINASACVGFSVEYKLSNRWKASGSISFRHFSNGSYKLPNMGLNIIPVSLGLQYSLSKERFNPDKVIISRYKSHNILSVFAAAGSKNYVSGEHNYLKTTVGIYGLRQFSYKYRAGLGLDIFYAADGNSRTSNNASTFSNTMSFGIVPTWEWIVQRKLCIVTSLGVYLHRNNFNDEVKPYYLRLGFRYCVTPHLYTGLSIKAHTNQSDFFEWTVGYNFHKDPNKY